MSQKPLPVSARITLAVILPLVTWWSTINMPVDHVNWISTLNNFGWLASGLFFIFYMPLRGFGQVHWILRILAALLAVSLFLTGFQAAMTYRKAQKDPGTQTQKQEQITKTRAFELVEQQSDVQALKQRLGAKFVIVLIAETSNDYLIGVGEAQRFDLQYRVTKTGEVVKQ